MPQRTGKKMTDRDGYTPAMRRRLAKLDEEIAQAKAEAQQAKAEARRAESAYKKVREEDAKLTAKWRAEEAKWRAEEAKWKEEGKEEAKQREKQEAKWKEEAKQREKQAAKDTADLRKTVKETSKAWGDFGRSEGEMVEEEFVNALREKKAIGDFKLREVLSRLKNRYEYDLVCINGRAVFVGEVKRQLTARDVRDFADNRLPHFAEDFPAHARRRTVHGMVGGVRVNPAAEREAKARRLVLLRLKNRALLAENLPRRAA